MSCYLALINIVSLFMQMLCKFHVLEMTLMLIFLLFHQIGAFFYYIERGLYDGEIVSSMISRSTLYFYVQNDSQMFVFHLFICGLFIAFLILQIFSSNGKRIKACKKKKCPAKNETSFFSNRSLPQLIDCPLSLGFMIHSMCAYNPQIYRIDHGKLQFVYFPIEYK